MYIVKAHADLFLCCSRNTVNPEIFARILFSRMTLKDIFATFKNDLPISVNDRMIS